STGRPSSREIVRTGSAHASSVAASNPPARTAAASVCRTSSRIDGSIAATAAGVNRSRTTLRRRSWSGGSAALKLPAPGRARAEQRPRVVGVAAPGAGDRPPLPRRALHVLEAAQRPEAPCLVAIHRLRPAQLRVCAIRIALGERVVVDQHPEIPSPYLLARQD